MLAHVSTDDLLRNDKSDTFISPAFEQSPMKPLIKPPAKKQPLYLRNMDIRVKMYREAFDMMERDFVVQNMAVKKFKTVKIKN